MMKTKHNTASGLVKDLIKQGAVKEILFFVVLLLVAAALFVPFTPNMPRTGLDESWVYGINEAVAQGMSFGKDIIFTYGPYAFVLHTRYHPSTYNLMIFSTLFFTISFVIAAYLNFRTAAWWLKIVLVVILTAPQYSKEALFFFYTMLVGVQIYHWSRSFDSKREVNGAEISLNLVLLAPFGLLPLCKRTELIPCLAVSLLSISLFARRREWRICVFIVAIPFLSLVAFWLLAGQPLLGIVDYFINSLPIISGYSEAMAVNGDPREYILYTLAAAFLLFCLVREAQGSACEKSIVALTFALILFVAFKAGFVRHDAHAIMAGNTILFAALSAGVLLTPKVFLGVLFVSFVAWSYIDAAYVNVLSNFNIKRNIKGIYSMPYIGYMLRKDPDTLTRNFDAAVAKINEGSVIPRLDGSVDIYPVDLSNLIASGNKWNPRPIFQSYSVYTAKLAELNKAHLLSDNRPENIIFKMGTIGGRLPSLDDGASWPVLLSNYEPTNFSNGYLFLKNRQDSSYVFEEPKQIGGGIYSLGEQINLPDSDTAIFAKIDIKKSFLGNIANTLFKPSQVAIKLTLHTGETRQYRLVSGAAKAGFVISPLIEYTEEFGLLLTDANMLNSKTVKSLEIIAPHFPVLWKDSFEIGFYPLDIKDKEFPGFSEKLGISIPRTASGLQASGLQISPASRCYRSMDSVNGRVSPESIKATTLLNVNGWLAAPADLTGVPERVYLVLSNSEGDRLFFDAKRTLRPNVEKQFKMSEEEVIVSGYAVTANVSKLFGKYQLGLAYQKDNEILVCPQFNIPIELN